MRQLFLGPAGLTKAERRCRSRDRQRGAAMLEFALTAIPFFMLLFGTIELGLIFVANLCLSNSTLALARQVRVGAVVLPGAAVTSPSGSQMSLSGFKTAICNGIPVVARAACSSQLQVDVRTQTAFSAQSTPNPISGQNFSTSGFCFYSGAPGNIVTMHVYLIWPLVTPAILNALASVTSVSAGGATSSGSFVVLTSNEVFKNEPNASASNTGNGC